MKKFLISALLASVIASPAAAAELVSNGGFEHPNGLAAGWSYSVSPSLNVLASPAAHSGNNWLRFIAEEEFFSSVIYQSVDTVVGETYAFSFWVAAATLTDGAPSSFLATIGGDAVVELTDSGSFDYLQFGGDYVATSTQTEIFFKAFNSGGLYLLDDVSLTGPTGTVCETRLPTGACGPGGGPGGAVPEPGVWALMLLGFGGVGAAIRRRRRVGPILGTL